MRIIGGKYRGKLFSPPAGLPVRPTKDRAKEALFNIIGHRFGIEGATVLDCFAGTGNITFEFLSRGAERVIAVEQHTKCADFIRRIITELKTTNGEVVNAEVRRFLASTRITFDIIFFDPPYALDRQEEMILTCLERPLLNPLGILVIEHQSLKSFSNLPHFLECRKYGASSFSIFQFPES
jgi:16S rRNA (guanine966-N2)-methyltransferase